jgi:hypothetical protein
MDLEVSNLTNKNSRNGIELGVVAHICNPSYSGDRSWEDEGSRPA